MAKNARDPASTEGNIDDRGANASQVLTRVHVQFGTNRKYVGGGEFYNGEFADPQYGSGCELGALDIAKIGSPPAWSYVPGSFARHPKRHEDGAPQQPDVIDDFLQRAMAKASTDRTAKSGGLVFIHGFNSKFLDTMEIAVGPIAEGYGHTNVLAFSWPSAGDSWEYKSDYDHAYLSGASAVTFFKNFYRKLDALGANRPGLDIVVHSMGHRVLSSVMRVLFPPERKAPEVYFNHALLMAADEDYRAFSQEDKLKRLPEIAKSISLYTNDADWILSGGGPLSGASELGLFGPKEFPVGDNVIWINVTEVVQDKADFAGFGHQYYRLSKPVIDDARAILAGQCPANREPDPNPALRKVKFKLTLPTA